MVIDCLVHVHSSFSYDSKTDLADIARTARRHGIRCVLMSEHNNRMTPDDMAAFVARCDELSDSALLIVPGLELAFDNNRVHLLALGVREYIDSAAPDCTFQSLVTSVRNADGVAVLAHPSHRQAVSRLAAGDLEDLHGIEIWNVKNGNRFVPTAQDLELLNRVRAAGGAAHGFAGLDWHHLNRFARLVISVDAASLSRDAILESLKTGAFTVRSGWVTLPSIGETRRVRMMAYKVIATTMAQTRRMAYRCQSRLERLGFSTPKVISAAARRLF